MKEVELGSDAGEETVFFLKDAYDFAVNTSRLAGQADVTDAPAFFELFTTPQYEAIVADRNSRFVDSDADGLTDVKEVELGSDAGEETVFFLKDAYDFAVNTSRLAGQADVTDAPAFFELFTTPQYEAIVADRDSRFVDTDGDGITDVKEAELETDATDATVFYLQGAYDIAEAQALQAGRDEVTTAPASFELFTTPQYEAIVADRNSRFVDSDADGITDVKEDELETNADEETIFFLKDAYDFAVNTSRLAGQADVTDAPAFFELFTTPQYEAIVADRDSRFVDTDGDGITDVKEDELETNADEETIFYLQGAYDIAEAQALQAGRDEVTTAPASFELFTTPQYEAIVADRDSRFVDSDADGITDVKEDELETNADEETIFFLKDAYDFAVNTSRLAGQADVTDAPAFFELFTTPQYEAIVADRDSRFVDSDADGLTDVKEVELGSDAGEDTVFFLKDAYDLAVNTSRLAGQADVTDAPAFFELFTTPQYDAIVADRDSRFVDSDADGLTDVKEAELETDTNEATVFYLKDAYDNAVVASKSQGRQAGRTDVTGTPGSFNLTTIDAYNTVIAQRDARPTQVSYDELAAERDARFVDTDGDGLTDVIEIELGTDSVVETSFYLQGAYDNAVALSNSQGRKAGQSEVIANPGSFNLKTNAAYNLVVAERDARFVDTDEDGLTDLKEEELESDTVEATTFYLKSSYDLAVTSSRVAGRAEVTTNPQNYGLKTNAAYNLVVAERDARFLDSDRDGLTDEKEIELVGGNVSEKTNFYLEGAFDEIAGDALDEALEQVSANPQNYGFVSRAAYNGVIAERDARFVDSDEDGLTDLIEANLGTNPDQVTLFSILEGSPNLKIALSRTAVKKDDNFLIAESNLQGDVQLFADSDLDGITDVKEQELNTDPAEQTSFYMKSSYDNAVAASRVAGRNDVTISPQNYGLTTTTAYQAIIVERDARFIDTDRDGLTDTKEAELLSDSAAETSFYLQGSYDMAVAEALQSGSDSVTNNPSNYNLTSSFAYDAVVAQRDARPTLDAYNAIIEERDARFVDTDEDGLTDIKELELETDSTVETIFYLQGAYDIAVAASNLEGRQAGRTDVTGAPGSFNLTTIEAYNTVIAQRDARPTQVSYDELAAERDARFVDTDEDGLTDIKELELETDSIVETIFYLQGAYDIAVAASNLEGRQAGRTDVTGAPGSFNLTTIEAYNTVIAQRDARPTQVSYDELAAERDARFVDTDEDGLTDIKELELETDPNETTLYYLTNDPDFEASMSVSRVAGRLDVTGNPANYNLTTSEAYNTVVAERDARFTEDQIRTMSVDHTVGRNEAGNMQVEIGFIQSSDLNTYTPLTVTPGSLSVVGGKICMEFPPSDDENFFYRFRIE